jgi:chorismate dehydratase
MMIALGRPDVIRIGAAPYLNTRILLYGLLPSSPEYTLSFHTPSVLGAKLHQGELDVALVSSIEYFRQPGYQILPDLAISGHREMWSVKLFHRGPLTSARRIALDPASLTANALLQIILLEKMQIGIELVSLQPGEDPLKRGDLDGFLKIGDPCLLFVPPPEYHALDLTSEWYLFTNLPFVFALWLTRRGIDLEGVNKALFLAKREGMRNVEALARADARRLGLDVLRVKTYLSKIVHYDLGRPELGGLDLFRKYLARQGLACEKQGFDFYTR